MEPMPREELERLVFFESAREQAEKDWVENPTDAHVRCARLRRRERHCRRTLRRRAERRAARAAVPAVPAALGLA
jgi:hypothetical protein